MIKISKTENVESKLMYYQFLIDCVKFKLIYLSF